MSKVELYLVEKEMGPLRLQIVTTTAMPEIWQHSLSKIYASATIVPIAFVSSKKQLSTVISIETQERNRF